MSRCDFESFGGVSLVTEIMGAGNGCEGRGRIRRAWFGGHVRDAHAEAWCDEEEHQSGSDNPFHSLRPPADDWRKEAANSYGLLLCRWPVRRIMLHQRLGSDRQVPLCCIHRGLQGALRDARRAEEDGAAITAGSRQMIESGSFVFRAELEDIHIGGAPHEPTAGRAGRLHTARSRRTRSATDLRLWLRNPAPPPRPRDARLAAGLDRPRRSRSRHGVPGSRTCRSPSRSLSVITYRPMSRCSDATETGSPIAGADSTRARSAPRPSPEPPFRSTVSRPLPRSVRSPSGKFARRGFRPRLCDRVSRRRDDHRHASVALRRRDRDLVHQRVRFIALSDAFTTGSSIMPQKRNPDAAELVRAKTGRLNGSLVALLTVMKGLPLAYGKDMQEEKSRCSRLSTRSNSASRRRPAWCTTCGLAASACATPPSRVLRRRPISPIGGTRRRPPFPPRPSCDRKYRPARGSAGLHACRAAARRIAGCGAGDHRRGL